ncbi:MAG: hypothetical protein KGN36_19860 [Acidobacteriota bacterium]|nr:hypothetical protein [Acidobacteriota bacterium]
MRLSLCLAALFVVCGSLRAQSILPVEDPAGAPLERVEKRALGVLPNYRTADASEAAAPITASRKMFIAYKDSTDFPVFPTAGVFAAIYQWADQNPSFGQGARGYALRYTTAYSDQVIGNVMIEGVLPSLLHEDPRYFRRGAARGSKRTRLLYALSRVFVTRTDSGATTFNFSEFGGNIVTAAAGNAYYAQSRRLEDNVQRFYINIGSDALGFVLKEFSPDLMRAFRRHKR